MEYLWLRSLTLMSVSTLVRFLASLWGERPFYGYMSEVRVWSVARSENQISRIC